MNVTKVSQYSVAGSAIPEGDTSYVLTQEDGDFWLWKAASGEHFSYTDSYCPLQSIACVIDHENVRVFCVFMSC